MYKLENRGSFVSVVNSSDFQNMGELKTTLKALQHELQSLDKEIEAIRAMARNLKYKSLFQEKPDLKDWVVDVIDHALFMSKDIEATMIFINSLNLSTAEPESLLMCQLSMLMEYMDELYSPTAIMRIFNWVKGIPNKSYASEYKRILASDGYGIGEAVTQS